MFCGCLLVFNASLVAESNMLHASVKIWKLGCAVTHMWEIAHGIPDMPQFEELGFWREARRRKLTRGWWWHHDPVLRV